MIFYKAKYQAALAENEAMKNTMKEVEINVNKMVKMYVSLSDQHTRLLMEYLKLQLQIEQLTCLRYRAVNNN